MSKRKEVTEKELETLQKVIDSVGKEKLCNSRCINLGFLACLWYKVYKTWECRNKCNLCSQYIEMDQPFVRIYTQNHMFEHSGRGKHYHLVTCFDQVLLRIQETLLANVETVTRQRSTVSAITSALEGGDH